MSLKKISSEALSSKKCFEDLKKNGLIKSNYKTFQTKSIGLMEGVTLFGTTKTGLSKKVYVKKYSKCHGGTPGFSPVNELSDYAAFIILKRCGVRVPKVKLEATKNAIYIFSEAFKKIEDHFVLACDEVRNKIKAMAFESDENKKAIYSLIDKWQLNFLALQKLVNKNKNAQTGMNSEFGFWSYAKKAITWIERAVGIPALKNQLDDDDPQPRVQV